MTLALDVKGVAIAAAVLVGGIVGGTAAAMGAAWLLSRLARSVGTDETPTGSFKITQPVDTKEDADAIRARADARSKAANEEHAKGRAIDSGEPPRTIKLASSGGWKRRA